MSDQAPTRPAEPRPALSVIVPTRRTGAPALQQLAALALAGSDTIEVLIGDNSADPGKRAFLAHLQATSRNVHVFCHPQDIGAYPNYLFLLRNASGGLVCLAADDDLAAPGSYAAAAAILAREPDVAAAAGLLIGATPVPGAAATLFQATSRCEPTALDRIRAFEGPNLLAYAVARREHVLRMARYLEDTPLRASFIDYLSSYALLAAGKVRIDPAAPAYLYINTQWSDEQTGWRNSAAYYVASGLPERFQHLHSLAWAIACLHLFLSRYRPPHLDAVEARQIAELLFLRWRDEFAARWHADPALYRNLLAGDAAAAVTALVGAPDSSPAQRFAWFVAVLAAFAPDLAERYRNFLDATLLDPANRPDAAMADTAAAAVPPGVPPRPAWRLWRRLLHPAPPIAIPRPLR